VSVLQTVQEELSTLERRGILRRPLVLEGPRGSVVRLDGREVVVFCSNDYLGLAADARLRTAMCAAVLEHGVGAGASRLISGTDIVHRSAERRLAQLVRMPDALLFSSGYAASLGALPALLGPGDVAFSDRLNHASMIDGLRLSRAEIHVYDHNDVSHVARLIEAHRADRKRAWIVTDSVFSMDGDFAPVEALRAVADRYDVGLYVDEAHALGVVGQGRGLCAERGVQADIVLGTLGKAAGLSGAFLASSPELRALLENRARSFVYSTAVGPALAATVETAVELLESGTEARERIRAHARALRSALRSQGWKASGEDGSPIVPVMIGTHGRTMELSGALLERGFFVQGIRPPTVPEGTSRLRVVATAAHTVDQVDALIGAFRELAPSP
jgi:8-amino-7-oxononanoate synthase